jgi:L-asparaginase/N4-(beta-N-acetylglucosaminyl)-L-asparaginase
MAFKLPGRVGDSPIIGHGLYVDPEIGAAVATGHGELAMSVCATFLAVEALRFGAMPHDAALEALTRVRETQTHDGAGSTGNHRAEKRSRLGCDGAARGVQGGSERPHRDELIAAEHLL